jgi:aldose 1-epimerase
MLTLRAGEWEAHLRPEIGGSLSALSHRGIAVLRPMPPEASSPLQAACFPLVPYCNRIRDGRFAVAGRTVILPANFPPGLHSLHGLGWQRPWTVESHAETKCVLLHEYDGTGAWPWAYRASQRIRLGPKGCAITLVLTNRAREPMPAGLGLHPYFRREAETELSFEAGHVLLTGTDSLPTGVEAPARRFADFAGGSTLTAEPIDHCFAEWRGGVVLHDTLGTIAIRAEGAPSLHVYAPADGATLCLEPVTHTPDAPNRAPGEMITLPPGCSASLTLLIAAGPASARFQ